MVLDYNSFNYPITEAHGIIKYGFCKQEADSNEILKITIDASKNLHAELVQTAAIWFREAATREAYIKTFYLHYLLSGYGRQEYGITLDNLCSILGTSKPTMIRINDILTYFRFITIDKNDWYQSILNSQDQNTSLNCFKYLAHWNTPAAKGANTLTQRNITLNYNIPDKLSHYLSILLNLNNKTHAATHPAPHYIRKDSERKQVIHNKFQIGNFEVFSPLYELLDVPQKDIGIYSADYDKWVCLRDREIKFQSGRIFHAFHNTKKEFRKLLKYKGSPLVEAIDVHCAHFAFLGKILMTIPSVEKDELKRYEVLVRDGLIYDDCKGYFPYYNRDAIKEALNAYRVIPSSKMGVHPANRYFKDRFPTIQKFLLHYPTYINKEGKEVKSIQKDTCFIETVLISQVCFELVKLGVTPFSLHDAIYINEKDNKKLKEMGVDIDTIFWMVYDSMTVEDIEEILEESRKYSENNSQTSQSYSPSSGKYLINKDKSVRLF